MGNMNDEIAAMDDKTRPERTQVEALLAEQETKKAAADAWDKVTKEQQRLAELREKNPRRNKIKERNARRSAYLQKVKKWNE